ncbi:MAG: peptidylprolyl isomerase [archaeon]
MKKEIAVFETTKGNFEIELNREKAPISVENFVGYVNSKFYDGLIFHRVISNFMIQGGGFDDKMEEKDTKPQIKNEAANGLNNDKYSVAMARTGVIDSATSQFFINVENNVFLNHKDDSVKGYGYAVFGKVISGFDVVEKIRYVPTDSVGSYDDVPTTPVVIKKTYMK